MSQAPHFHGLSLEARRRVGSLLFVLLVHIGLGLLLLLIAPDVVRKKVAEMVMFSVSAPSEKPAPKAPPQQQEAAPRPERQPPRPPSVEPPPAARTLPPEPLIAPPDLPPVQVPTITPAPAPPAANRPMMGPPDLRPRGAAGGDSQRVEGSGPNGEPLYAAAWYREPYDDELSGFLSTAQGPGWGLIACRTVADYRVEDCVFVAEYPSGSRIARSVLAAAWQFRVRPPRIGGRDQVGEWVRIRIDYQTRRETR